MIRAFIARLFDLDKPCACCKVLHDALDYERLVNKDLVDTITSLVKPAPVVQYQQETRVPPVNKPILWTARRQQLEEQERQKAQTLRTSNLVAKPDPEVQHEVINEVPPVGFDSVKNSKTIDELEAELGVVSSDSDGGGNQSLQQEAL